MQHRKKNRIISVVAGLGMGALCLSPAAGKTWTDVSGKHTLDAEFVALEKGRITLKTTTGRETTFPFKNLCESDREYAMAFALGESGTPTSAQTDPLSAGKIEASATARLVESIHEDRNGKQTVSRNLKVKVSLTGGSAAEAYAVGEAKFEPAVIGGKGFKPREGIHIGDFAIIDREKPEFFNPHPDGGVGLAVSYEKVPEDAKQIGTLRGSVVVLAGGTENTVKLDELLTRTESRIKDSALEAAGLEMIFTRMPQGDDIEVGISMSSGAKGFAGMKLIGPDGKPVENTGSGSMSAGDVVEHTIYAPKTVLEKSTLHILVRNGKEVELPFELTGIKVGK